MPRIVRRKNHGGELPYDEWIPVHAVKFNDDGTVDLMCEEHVHDRLENIQGYYRGGSFHPIRWDMMYDPEHPHLKHEEDSEYNIMGPRSTARARADFYRRTGERPPKKRRRK